MNIQPIDNTIYVKILMSPETILGSEMYHVEIVALGPDVNITDEENRYTNFSVGDKLITNTYEKNIILIEGEKFLFIDRLNILAVVTE